MEDMTVQFLERSLHEKILLYNDLLLCFKEEKEALVNVDLDRLWHISKKKEELYQTKDNLFPPIIQIRSEAKSLTKAIREIINNPEKAKKIGDIARSTVQRLHGIEAITSAVRESLDNFT